MLWLALMACRDKEPDVVDRDPGTWNTTVDTGIFVDTSDPKDTASDTGDTGDTGQKVADPDAEVVSVSLYPDGLTVHPGATFSLRMVGIWDDDSFSNLTGTYTTSDKKIATVDKDGVVTAHSPGTVTLTAGWEKQTEAVTITLLDEVTLTVTDDGLLTVTVIDAVTGAPITDAKVTLFEEDTLYANGSGQVTAKVADGGPVVVTAYLSDYIPATIWQTVSRNIVVPLHPASSFEARGTASGTMNFESVDSGEVTDIVMGIVIPNMPFGPLMLDPDDLLAEDRTVSLYGIDADVPANLVLKNHAESFEASVIAGESALWTIAGAMPISEVTSGLNGTTDAIALLRDHIDDMVWGWSDAGSISGGSTASVGIAPSVPFTEEADVVVPDLSIGFNGSEDPLVMVGELLPEEGVVVTGLGLGLGEVGIQTAAHTLTGSTGQIAMSIAQVGGLGTGGAVAATWGEVVEGEAVLPAFQDIPEVSSFDPITHEFTLHSDARSSLTRVLIEGADGTQRLLYLTGGEHSGTLPSPGFPMGYGNTSWTILALEHPEDTLEGRLVTGSILTPQIALTSRTSARVGSNFTSAPPK